MSYIIRILVDGQANDWHHDSEIIAEARYSSTEHLVTNDDRYHDFEVSVQLIESFTDGREPEVRYEFTKPMGE